MKSMLMLVPAFIAVICAVVFAYLVFRFGSKMLQTLILNSVAGLVALFITNLFGIGVPINIITIAIVAFGGFAGYVLVLIFFLLGIL
ncbi:MAG: pro-sigmaK processing inhibitor BofA family protein [Candidatus Anstonellales archaeon]